MNRESFAVTLRKKPELLRAMLAFNGLLAFPALPDTLAALPHAHTLWQEHAVRRRFGASCPPTPDFWDFADEPLRLALVDAQTLDRLALTFGVAALAPDICRLVRKNEVRDARAHLGDALYTYALHRARFQVEPGVAPVSSMPDDAPLNIRAQAVGAQALRALTPHWPAPLRACVARDTLCGSGPVTGTEQVLDTDQQKRLWVAVKKVLLKEVAPLWAPCFD